MLVVSSLGFRFPGAEAPTLQNISFVVNAGQRVGLIGPNGSGKSTLLRLIMGLLPADSGSVTFTPPDLRIGYLAQGPEYPPETPVHDVLFPQASELAALETQLAELGPAMADGDETALQACEAALERMAALGYDVDTAAGERMLAHMGLADVGLDMPVGRLSGGQKSRLLLASILLGEPQLLLLDEPTNHLDIQGLEWLEEWLMDFKGGVLLVSHDRAFLDRVVDRVVALDQAAASARVFAGSYSDYLATLRHEHDKQYAQWRDQQDEIGRLRADAQRTMQRAINKENATVNDRQRRYAKKVAKRAKAKERRLERYIEDEERVEKPGQTWRMRLDLDELPRAYGSALMLEALSVGYTGTPPLLAGLDLTVQGGQRVAIMGPNGHGKTTLLRTIAGELLPLAGRVRPSPGVQLGYLAQEQDLLDPASTALATVQQASRMGSSETRSFLHYFLFSGDDVFRPVARLSYGERARLMLALLVARGANLLLMDEPLNHLDLPSREQFEAALANFRGSVLAVVHDRYFAERFASTVWHVENGTLRVEHRQPEAV